MSGVNGSLTASQPKPRPGCRPTTDNPQSAPSPLVPITSGKSTLSRSFRIDQSVIAGGQLLCCAAALRRCCWLAAKHANTKTPTQRRNDAMTQQRNDATTQRRNDATTQRRNDVTTTSLSWSLLLTSCCVVLLDGLMDGKTKHAGTGRRNDATTTSTEGRNNGRAD